MLIEPDRIFVWVKTASQPRPGPGRRILTEAVVNQIPHATPSDHDVSVMSTYSVFTVSVKDT
jgi:hypothetical protein